MADGSALPVAEAGVGFHGLSGKEEALPRWGARH